MRGQEIQIPRVEKNKLDVPEVITLGPPTGVINWYSVLILEA